MLGHEFCHRRPAEGRIEVYLGPLIVDDPSSEFVCAGHDYLLRKVHHVLVIGVGPVDLKGGELWVMLHIHSLVAELLPYLVYPAEHADHKPLEVKLCGYPQVHVYVERVVMSYKWPRVRSPAIVERMGV